MSRVSRRREMSLNFCLSARRNPPVTLSLICSWLSAIRGKSGSSWKRLSWYMSSCIFRVSSLTCMTPFRLSSPPKPYGNSHGNICGYNCGLWYRLSGVLFCPMPRTCPLTKCSIAFALTCCAFSFIMATSLSPVSPKTVKGHCPSIVPSSSSVSLTAVDSASLVALADCW